MEVRRKGLRSMRRLLPRMQLAGYASAVLHPLIRVVDGPTVCVQRVRWSMMPLGSQPCFNGFASHETIGCRACVRKMLDLLRLSRGVCGVG